MPAALSHVVLDQAAIAQRVVELGEQITSDFAGQDVRLVTVLRGGLFFLADLCRAVDLPVTLDFMAVSPYTPGVGGAVRVTKDLSDTVDGASVLLVEDVVDTGLTVNYVYSLLKARGARSVDVCTLLDKPARRIAPVPIAYCGFVMPDRFLVGYGLDLDGRYRNLTGIVALHEEGIAS
ncbi:MAG: hypoxanthine phosphoribosyltransferase [Coriobacteriia bacterium]|nr:hypoxanthine phosphoribosyltransferase [Coriobacteriia bacterium]